MSNLEEDLRKSLLDVLSVSDNLEKYNSNLAGDIKDEFNLSPDKIRRNLYQAIERSILSHLKNIVVDNSHFKLNSLWVNYQRKNEYNPAHIHHGAFSFVWYLDIPQEIRDEYKQQKSYEETKTRGLIQFTSLHTNEYIILNPQTDDFLLFRANHNHQVYPFYSDNTRISVSGNIIIDE